MKCRKQKQAKQETKRLVEQKRETVKAGERGRQSEKEAERGRAGDRETGTRCTWKSAFPKPELQNVKSFGIAASGDSAVGGVTNEAPIIRTSGNFSWCRPDSLLHCTPTWRRKARDSAPSAVHRTKSTFVLPGLSAMFPPRHGAEGFAVGADDR
ncbi:uncharacterized [Tachysurus ichikawai]